MLGHHVRHTLDSMCTQLNSSKAGEGTEQNREALVSCYSAFGDGNDLALLKVRQAHPRKEPMGVRATEAM